jgi:hypothetical protein
LNETIELERAVTEWTHNQYDALEGAILRGTRIAAYRRGTEFVVIPMRLRVIKGREAVEATHPTTGDAIMLYLDELDSFEVVR